MKLHIAYFYPKLLNLYGDTGNVEILAHRAKARNIDVEVTTIGVDTSLSPSLLDSVNFVFMGGGPDSSQKNLHQDLIGNKADFITDYIHNGGAGLYICGAYQLLGKYYKSSDGTEILGVGALNFYTEHFGTHKQRCVGNITCTFEKALKSEITKNYPHAPHTLVGFENHGGRTYFLSNELHPLATVKNGFGNNGEDKTEGTLYKNSVGTYLHGPILSKNPHLADLLIQKSLNIESLEPLSVDRYIWIAHKKAVLSK